jgi:predicted HTH transcriptional regulator
MLHAMREANLEPPRFDDRRASFRVTFHNHTLMTAEAISWLNQFSHLPLNDHQRLALVYLRQHPHIDNRDYRRLNRVDMMTAGHDLREMVQADLVEQTGFGRWTKYILKSPDIKIDDSVLKDDEKMIIAYIKKHGFITNADCRDLLQTGLHNTTYFLKKMTQKGLIKREGKHRWTRYRLP